MKRDKRRILRTAACGVIAVANFAVIASCATFVPCPRGIEDTLVIGKYGFVQPIPGNMMIAASGKVIVFMKSTESEEFHRLRSYSNTSFLYGGGAEPGHYEVTLIRFENTIADWRYELEIKVAESTLFLDIRSGFVNNFGILRFKFDENVVYIERAANYDSIEEQFAESYPKSKWRKYPWLEI